MEILVSYILYSAAEIPVSIRLDFDKRIFGFKQIVANFVRVYFLTLYIHYKFTEIWWVFSLFYYICYPFLMEYHISIEQNIGLIQSSIQKIELTFNITSNSNIFSYLYIKYKYLFKAFICNPFATNGALRLSCNFLASCFWKLYNPVLPP